MKLYEMKERILKFLSVFLATLLLFSAVSAQNTTLRGQVIDELGAVIPNAEITLIGADGKQRITKSNSNGEFSIANVPPGVYTLTIAFKGFQNHVEDDLKVPLERSPLVITMIVAAVNVVEDVSANNAAVSAEPDQNMNAIVLGEDFIKDLPDNEDDLRDFLQALAGPTASAGSGGQGAQILVDGFNGGRLPPREAIMQIRVNQNPFSAEYSNPGFGRIEIITKPGSDQWRGSGSFGYRNSALDARNAFALEKPELTLNRFSFNFGGPFIKKRMSATFFADRFDTEGSNTTVAKTLEGDFVANVPSQTLNHSFGVQADYLLNKKNTLNMRYYYRKSEIFNREFASRFGGGFGGGGGGGGFGGGFGGGGGGAGLGGNTNYYLPGRGSDLETSDHTLRLSETWIISPKMIHETRFEFERERSQQTARTDGVAINVLDSFLGGGSPCCPNIARQDEIEFQDYLTYTTRGSKHTIKGGIQLEYEWVNDISGNNFNGTYTFSTLDQYRIATAAIGTPLARAAQLTINQGNPLIKYSMYEASWFVGDDWRISPSLTLSFGLRHEFQNHLRDKVNFAPRFGVAWSPFKSRKTTIRGGGGIFYERLGSGLYENSIRYDGQRQQSYILRNAIFALDPIAANPDLDLQEITRRPLDPKMKAPYNINGSLSVEQQLPKGFVGSVTYIFSRGIHQFRTRDINAPFLVPDPNDPSKTSFVHPYPNAGFIYQAESSAISETNRLNFGFNRRLPKFTVFGNYTLSWIKSNGEGLPANSYDLRAEWGRSFADRRHNFFTGTFFTLPKGFRITTFINATSGAPFNITTGEDENRDGSFTDRPLDANGRPIGRNADLPASLYSLPQFDRFVCPPGKNCNSGSDRRIRLGDFLEQTYPNGVKAQGPGFFSVNLNVSKTFGFGKQSSMRAQGGIGGGRGPGGGPGGRVMVGGPRGMGGPGGGPGGMGGPVMIGGDSERSRFNLTLQVGINNLFNRVNFTQYGGVLGSGYFGLPSSALPARQLDFNVRFNF